MPPTKSKIILLLQAPFSRRDYDRFGIDILLGSGRSIEAWDVSRILHPGAEGASKAPIFWPGHRIFDSSAQVRAALAGLERNSLAISFFHYSLGSYPIYKALSELRIRYGLFMANLLPPAPPSRLAMIPKVTPRRLVEKAFSFIPPGWIGVRPAAFILAGGEKSFRRWPIVSAESLPLWLHTLDYDLYLAAGSPGPGSKEPLGVFLDECVPFHPDYTLVGLRPPQSPDAYYGALREFFPRAERALGLEIAVAAHPRSDYDAHPGLFGSRKVFAGQTLDLVRRARVVFAHGSTAINFAVLMSKPVVFLTSGPLSRDVVGRQTAAMAAMLRKQPRDLEDRGAIDWERELAIDAGAYASYRNDYIKKKGSEDAPFWQIVASSLP